MTSVNVASRLETSGEPASVVAGESTYHAIADRVRATSLGLLDLKGKEKAIRAYRLESIHSAASSP